MGYDNNQQINEQLVREIRDIAANQEDVFEVLAFLKTKVFDYDMFVKYFITAFEDTHWDEGSLWLIASRYWHNAISKYAADILFQQARENKPPL